MTKDEEQFYLDLMDHPIPIEVIDTHETVDRLMAPHGGAKWTSTLQALVVALSGWGREGGSAMYGPGGWAERNSHPEGPINERKLPHLQPMIDRYDSLDDDLDALSRLPFSVD